MCVCVGVICVCMCGCDTYQSSLRWQNFSVFVCLSNNRSTTSGFCLQREMEGERKGGEGDGEREGEGGTEKRRISQRQQKEGVKGLSSPARTCPS